MAEATATVDHKQLGIALNGAYQAVINSYLNDIHADGTESKGINGWAGPGPFTIYNNHIEAAGVNVFFGGASTWIENINPSDIVIARNHITKDLAWRQASPGSTRRRTIKAT